MTFLIVFWVLSSHHMPLHLWKKYLPNWLVIVPADTLYLKYLYNASCIYIYQTTLYPYHISSTLVAACRRSKILWLQLHIRPLFILLWNPYFALLRDFSSFLSHELGFSCTMGILYWCILYHIPWMFCFSAYDDFPSIFKLNPKKMSFCKI